MQHYTCGHQKTELITSFETKYIQQLRKFFSFIQINCRRRNNEEEKILADTSRQFHLPSILTYYNRILDMNVSSFLHFICICMLNVPRFTNVMTIVDRGIQFDLHPVSWKLCLLSIEGIRRFDYNRPLRGLNNI